jgi:hypothetical protein
VVIIKAALLAKTQAAQQTVRHLLKIKTEPKFGKQQLVINFRNADPSTNSGQALTDKPVFYICNRLRWQAKGITTIRRHRWPVEVYYEEGKAEGLDQYQSGTLRAYLVIFP